MKTTKTIAVLAVTSFLTTVALVPANAQQAGHHPAGGQAGKTASAGMSGMKGSPKMKMGMMKGKMGMMGKGGMMGMMHKKMMAHHMGFTRAKPLSAIDVGRIVDGQLSMQGLTRLKTSNVQIKDDKTATATLATVGGETVAKISVDRQTGKVKIIE